MTDDPTNTTHNDSETLGRGRARLAHWIVWLASLVGLTAFIGLARVDTYLGVEAPRWDKRGEEYVWRVWWRARDDLIEVSPSWMFDVAFVAASLLFVALAALGLWLLLVPDREESVSDRAGRGATARVSSNSAESLGA